MQLQILPVRIAITSELKSAEEKVKTCLIVKQSLPKRMNLE